jgi:hypothetical protein
MVQSFQVGCLFLTRSALFTTHTHWRGGGYFSTIEWGGGRNRYARAYQNLTHPREEEETTKSILEQQLSTHFRS